MKAEDIRRGPEAVEGERIRELVRERSAQADLRKQGMAEIALGLAGIAFTLRGFLFPRPPQQ